MNYLLGAPELAIHMGLRKIATRSRRAFSISGRRCRNGSGLLKAGSAKPEMECVSDRLTSSMVLIFPAVNRAWLNAL